MGAGPADVEALGCVRFAGFCSYAGLACEPAQAAGRDWAITGVHPIGQPIAVGGVAVGYVERDKHVYARGLHPSNGDVLWEREITPTRQTIGIELVPHAVGAGAVTFMTPLPQLGPDWARVVVVDAATGQVRQSSPSALFRAGPEACFDDRAVCVMATPDADRPMRGDRLDLTTGSYEPYSGTGIPATARCIGDRGLYDLGARPDEEIALIRDGEMRWHRPLADAFPAGFSTSNGWNWTLYPQVVYAGSVFGRGIRTKTTLDRDMHADSGSAGLDEMTGTVLWHEVGTVVSCGGQVPLWAEPVRCRVHGKQHIDLAAQTGSFKDLDVVLEGFDPITGSTTWSVPADASEQLGGFTDRAAIAGEHAIVATADTPSTLGDRRFNPRAVPPSA
ncbi:hypothetical protein [Actinoplanes sp. NPDC049118]|uniref:hypothetical protein n=1 Tax=Actinoplanes sp. NPDC049118 TaxID=3155769 RepID=UPI003409775B